MQSPTTDLETARACEPIWVRFNPLYSYCIKTTVVPLKEHDGNADDARLCCRKKSCVFSKNRS